LVAQAAASRSSIPPQKISSIHWGMMYQTEGSSVYLPRHAALKAGLSPSAPAVITNRLCGSGLEAVIDAARCLLLREAEFVLSGSTDAISRASNFRLLAKTGLHDVETEDPVTASTLDQYCGKRVAQLADGFARENDIARDDLDRFAFESRSRAANAQKRLGASAGLAPVPVPAGAGDNGARSGRLFVQDQLEGRWPTLSSLAALPSRFGEDGRITRGNTSAFADGACALVLANEQAAAKSRCPMLARLRSWAIAASAPERTGDALVTAVTTAAEKAGISLSKVDWFEFEEAFAVYCVYAVRKLGIPKEKVNPLGGALAFGHAPASSGLRLLFSTIHGFTSRSCRFALAAVSLGAGQAMSVVLENMNG
jgi:acetyl-CoA acyltransferase 2